jgi:hypothetical protein
LGVGGNMGEIHRILTYAETALTPPRGKIWY